MAWVDFTCVGRTLIPNILKAFSVIIYLWNTGLETLSYSPNPTLPITNHPENLGTAKKFWILLGPPPKCFIWKMTIQLFLGSSFFWEKTAVSQVIINPFAKKFWLGLGLFDTFADQKGFLSLGAYKTKSSTAQLCLKKEGRL